MAGTAIERFYHHLFQSDREIVALAEEIGIGDRLLWLPSNVGYFADGRIWPLNGALDLLRLGFLPIQDRLRVGLVTAYLQRVRDWKRFESVTAASWLRRALGQSRLRPHLRRAAAGEVRPLSRPGRHGLVLGQDLVADDLPALTAGRRAARLFPRQLQRPHRRAAAGMIMRSGGGIIFDIVVGIVGALIAGFLFGGGASILNAPLNVMSILLSLVGAIILLAIYKLIVRGRV